MTLFFIFAALMVALCLLWLLVGLFKTQGESLDQEAVNIKLARERGATLTTALNDGSIDQSTYDYEREQLDYDLAADLTSTANPVAKRGGHIAAAAMVAFFVPIAAGSLYIKLGNPDAITQDRTQRASAALNSSTPPNSQAQLPGPLVDLLPKLEERLEAAPDDIQGWRLLGRSYLSIRKYALATNAFEKALALDDNDVTTMTQLAESIAMSRNGALTGDPMVLLDRANSIDPQHEHTLWLRSIGKQQAGDHQEALIGFNLLMGLSKDNPDAVATVDQMRSQSIQALGANSVRQLTDDGATEEDNSKEASAGGPAIQVTVSIDPTFAESTALDSAVFVYATATTGPPMPLAVVKLTLGDLPATIVLDDSMAMIPSMTLSTFSSVTVGARVSASGNPIAQSGDWFSEATNLVVSETPSITLVIDKITP